MMQVAINARVMLRRNISTCGGLVNGAMATIAGFECPEGQRITGQQPSDLNIVFDDQRVGGQTRGTADRLATTIRPATSRFSGKDGRHQFERYQYPIVLAWAVTVHTVQGISLNQIWTRLSLILGKTSLIMARLHAGISRCSGQETSWEWTFPVLCAVPQLRSQTRARTKFNPIIEMSIAVYGPHPHFKPITTCVLHPRRR